MKTGTTTQQNKEQTPMLIAHPTVTKFIFYYSKLFETTNIEHYNTAVCYNPY